MQSSLSFARQFALSNIATSSRFYQPKVLSPQVFYQGGGGISELFVATLDLGSYFGWQNQNLRFVDIMSRIWTLRYAISNLISLCTLRIYCFIKCLPFYIDTWSTPIPHVLQKLDLTITKPLVGLPFCLFSTTLVSLSLIGNIFLNPPTSRFPNLRILVLRSAEFANSESLPTLLTAQPVFILEIHKHNLILFA